jgi:hypothetical protein
MALVDNTTYTGKDTDGFFSVALLTGNSKTRIRLVPNVKSTIKLGSLNLGDVLQADSCSVSASGTYTLAQKTLEVCPIAVKVPICQTDYEANYLSESMKPGSNVEENFPNGFVDYLFNLIAEKISEQTEELLWQGDVSGSPSTLCDGLIVKMIADATVVDVAGTTLTASNIIAEITKVYNAVPETISESGKVVIFISRKAAKLYRQALVTANPALIAYNNGDFTLRYIDIELVVAPGMLANRMVAADPMNLWYGCDLVTDEEKSLELVTDPLNKKQSYIITTFKWGCNYGVGSEIVLYS